MSPGLPGTAYGLETDVKSFDIQLSVICVQLLPPFLAGTLCSNNIDIGRYSNNSRALLVEGLEEPTALSNWHRNRPHLPSQTYSHASHPVPEDTSGQPPLSGYGGGRKEASCDMAKVTQSSDAPPRCPAAAELSKRVFRTRYQATVSQKKS